MQLQLTAAQEELLKFLVKPKTARQCAAHIGYSIESIYKPLRVLQRLDLVDKKPGERSKPSFFVATGRKPAIEPGYVQVRTRGITVMGVVI